MNTGVGGECEEEACGWASPLCEAYYTTWAGSIEGCWVYDGRA